MSFLLEEREEPSPFRPLPPQARLRRGPAPFSAHGPLSASTKWRSSFYTRPDGGSPEPAPAALPLARGPGDTGQPGTRTAKERLPKAALRKRGPRKAVQEPHGAGRPRTRDTGPCAPSRSPWGAGHRPCWHVDPRREKSPFVLHFFPASDSPAASTPRTGRASGPSVRAERPPRAAWGRSALSVRAGASHLRPLPQDAANRQLLHKRTLPVRASGGGHRRPQLRTATESVSSPPGDDLGPSTPPSEGVRRAARARSLPKL